MKSNCVLPPVLSRCAALALLLAAFTPTARAAANANPPDKLTYQGYLVDGNGAPLGSANPKNYDVVFRLFADQTGGTSLWAEQQTVTVDNGQFSVILGEGSQYGGEAHPLLSTVFNSATASDRFVEMTVKGIGPSGADSTLLPRVRLLPGPYAFLSRYAINANGLVNSSNTSVMTVSGTSLGINKASPTSALDVNGTVTATGMQVNGSETVSGTVTAATFVGNGTIPVGGIIMWSGNPTSVPQGWALCDGQTVNGQKTPNLSGRFILAAGSGSGLTSRSVNQTGGEESHTLTVAELPAHNHGITDPGHGHDVTDPGHNHKMTGNADGWNPSNVKITDRNGDTAYTQTAYTGIKVKSATTGVSVNNAGSGQAHNTMPPYYVLAFIMRVQ